MISVLGLSGLVKGCLPIHGLGLVHISDVLLLALCYFKCLHVSMACCSVSCLFSLEYSKMFETDGHEQLSNGETLCSPSFYVAGLSSEGVSQMINVNV